MANILKGLVSSSLANLEVPNSVADLDDDTRTFVACAFGAELGHLWQRPVVHHEVDIGHAETGDVELDENIFGSCSQH